MSRKALNTELPVDLVNDVTRFAEAEGMTKKEVVYNALRQYMTIKQNEKAFRKQNPDDMVRAMVVFQTYDDQGAESRVQVY